MSKSKQYASSAAERRARFVVQRRSYMTLLEIMIVLAVIVIATGGIAISVQKAIVHQQFQTEVSILIDELTLAQNLMLVLGTDVHVKIKAEANKNITYWIETETELPPSMATEILKKKHELKTVKAFHHKDAKGNELDIRFLSHGDSMTDGIITLATTEKSPLPKNALQAYICLSGYPRPISSVDTLEAAEKQCASIADKEFDKELTLDTMLKAPDVQVQKEEIQTTPQKEAGK